MRRFYYATLLLSALCSLSMCGRHEPPPMPIREPEHDQNYSSPFLNARLTTNTNCVNPNEDLTIILYISNPYEVPLTLTRKPVLDIVIAPYGWPGPNDPASEHPVRRWSESSQYPHPLNPIIAPGEERTYTWVWKADPAFLQVPDGQRPASREITIAVITDVNNPASTMGAGNTLAIDMSIGAAYWWSPDAGPAYVVKCDDMPLQ